MKMNFQKKKIEEIKVFKDYNNNETINIVRKFIKLSLTRMKKIRYIKKMIIIRVKKFIKSNIIRLNKILKKRIANSNPSNRLISRITL